MTVALAALVLVTAGVFGDAPAASGGRDDRANRRHESSRGSQLRFMWAMAGQESGWDYYARNRVSGAYGKYQIMPSNWPSWAEAYLGSRHADQTPWNQERVAYGRLRDLYRTLRSWPRVAYWWLTGSNERRRDRWSPYAAAYVRSIMRLQRRAPSGWRMPRRTPSQAQRGAWRVVDGRQVLRHDASGKRWGRDGRIRSGSIVRIHGTRKIRPGVPWLRVVTRDGRLGWLRRARTMPARRPDGARRWRDVRDRGSGDRDDRREVRPRPR